MTLSRVCKQPIKMPAGVNATLDGQRLTVKGPKGELELLLHPFVKVIEKDQVLYVSPHDNVQCPRNQAALLKSIPATMRSLTANMVFGVSEGFEKKLKLVGVGYRAQLQGKALNLTLGFSHPVIFDIPQDITIETPDQTTIIVKGINKQRVGQIAAEIRAYRRPEPYKGKGVRYVDEVIKMKETKKK
jgi:large subunit ribosomal protein L6